MITIKFSDTFRKALINRVERHQKKVVNLLESIIDNIYDHIIEEIRYYHENHNTWLFWCKKKTSYTKCLRYYYSGETFDKEEIRKWMLENSAKCSLKYDDLSNKVVFWSLAYSRVKNNEHYKRALMLLKYCSSFETVTVPLDFLLWFEK